MQTKDYLQSTGDIIYTPLQPPISTIIWLHGGGDTAENAFNLFKSNSAIAQQCKIIIPQAPLLYYEQYQSNINAWYRLNKDGSPNEADINKYAIKIMNIAKSELNYYKDSSKLIIGGFSLGAILALYLYSVYKLQCGKVICISGKLVMSELIEMPLESKTLVRIWHGNCDDVINCEEAKKSYQPILGMPNVKMSIVDGIGHSTSPNELKEIMEFILAQ